MTAREQCNASLLVERNIDAGRATKTAFIASDATLAYKPFRQEINRMASLLRELESATPTEVVLFVLADSTDVPNRVLRCHPDWGRTSAAQFRDTPANYRHFVSDSYAKLLICGSQQLATLREA